MYLQNFIHVVCVLLNYSSARKEVMEITFGITVYDGLPKCKTADNLNPAQKNQNFKIKVTSNTNVSFGTCSLRENRIDDVDVNFPFLNLLIDQSKKNIVSDEKAFDSSMNKKFLICKFGIDIPILNKSIPVISNNGKNFPCANCYAQLLDESGSPTDGGTEGSRDLKPDKINNNELIIMICCVVGFIVVLIIVGQKVALLYFKSRAQARNRLESLVSRDGHFDRNDQARYSAPPSRRNTKTCRATAETDSHIYEMVGVNALYKESVDLDIKNRPPLPLPGETPEPPPVSLDTLPRPPKSKLLASTLSLNSTSSSSLLMTGKPRKKELPPPPTTTNKAPCRPPKQLDEASLIGSLACPPKPLPLPKNYCSMPKMPSTDPALIELKNALKKRNIGNASPKPSPPSTIERKSPPKTLAKPKPLPQPKPTTLPKTQTPASTNPIPPNMKLILPKIEACLKSPPAKLLKPEVLPANKVSSEVSLPRPAPGPSILAVGPPVSTPAPIQPSKPLPTQDLEIPRHLPPIRSEEDISHYSDDEDWTYEQLEQYNIYNV